MRMMVPAKWGPLLESPLFSWQARLAYLREPKRARELKAAAPSQDESVADSFAATLERKSPPPLPDRFWPSLRRGHNASQRSRCHACLRPHGGRGGQLDTSRATARTESPQAIFTSLASGLETLIDRMGARLPSGSVRLRQPVLRMEADHEGWRFTTAGGPESFDAVVLATPPHVTGAFLRQFNDQGARIAGLLPQQATSAIVVALAFAPEQASRLRIPRGFGFVVPPLPYHSAEHKLLACTFVDQKFPGRVPQGAVLVRAFFGGHSGEALQGEADDQIIERARLQLSRVLGPLPQAIEAVVRRWPQSMPQYAVGHLERMAEVQSLLSAIPGLHLVGSAYHGVGLPDLIREGRATARLLAGGELKTAGFTGAGWEKLL